MSTTKISLLLVVAGLCVTACSPENSDLYHGPHSDPVPTFDPLPPAETKPVYPEVKPTKLDPYKQDEAPVPKTVDHTIPAPPPIQPRPRKTDTFDIKNVDMPQVDVVFMMDTSQSMKNDLNKLEKNIDHFIDAFLKNPFLDFHIAVVTAWDNRLFHDVADQKDCKLGEMRPLGRGQCAGNTSPRFLTRDTPNLKAALKVLLKPSIEPYIKENPIASGPRKEEFFAPMIKALTEPMISTVNAGFRRTGANLVIATFTDGDDGSDGLEGSSSVDASEVAQFLNSFMSNDVKVMTFGALGRYTESLECDAAGKELPPYKRTLPGCKESSKDIAKEAVDEDLMPAGGGPYRMRDFLKRTRSGLDGPNAFDLLSPNYGAEIGRIAQDIVAKSDDISLHPTSIVDLSQPIEVKYGDVTVPPLNSARNNGGWVRNKDSGNIEIHGSTLSKKIKDGKVTITYTPVPLVEPAAEEVPAQQTLKVAPKAAPAKAAPKAAAAKAAPKGKAQKPAAPKKKK